MKVEAGDYVLFHYVGRFEDGEVFDTSYEEIARENGILVEEREYGPMWVRIGVGEIIPGLDEAIIGMEAGEKKTVTVPPEKAYGMPNPELVISVPREEFTKAGLEPQEGLYVMTDSGIAKIVSVGESEVSLDFNHPLAGKTLVFEVEVIEVKRPKRTQKLSLSIVATLNTTSPITVSIREYFKPALYFPSLIIPIPRPERTAWTTTKAIKIVVIESMGNMIPSSGLLIDDIT